MLSQVKLKSGIDFCLNRQDSHEARNAKEYASSNEEGSGFKQKIKGLKEGLLLICRTLSDSINFIPN